MSKTNLVAFLLILKTYFELKQCTLLFQNEKAYSGNYARDGGFNLVKTGGLFSKFTCERVTSNPGRRSRDGRLELNLGEREREGVVGTVAATVAQPWTAARARRRARYRG